MEGLKKIFFFIIGICVILYLVKHPDVASGLWNGLWDGVDKLVTSIDRLTE